MSQAFARLGSAVTIIQRAPRLLTVADADCSAVMADVFRAEGIEVRLGDDRAGRADRRRNRRDARRRTDRGDALLVAGGERPNVDGLGLDRAGSCHNRRDPGRCGISIRASRTSTPAATSSAASSSPTWRRSRRTRRPVTPCCPAEEGDAGPCAVDRLHRSGGRARRHDRAMRRGPVGRGARVYRLPLTGWTAPRPRATGTASSSSCTAQMARSSARTSLPLGPAR